MLKIGKNEIINDNLIESISTYESVPLYRLAKNAREKNAIREIRGRYGFKSIMILSDGYIVLCPNNPEIYFERLDKSKYLVIDSKRYFIKKDMIREITMKPNTKQHIEIKEGKEKTNYINLSKNKAVKYYIFTVNGRIYGVNQIKGGVDKILMD